MKNISSRSKIVITIILFVLLYTFFAIYSDMDKISMNYRKINYLFLIPISTVMVTAMFLSSLRQRFLLKKLGLNLDIKQNFLLYVSGLSMLITPFGSGQMIKSYYIEKKFGCAISNTGPLVFIERFSDLLAICIIVLFTIFFYHSYISLVLVILSVILLGGLLLAFTNKNLLKIIISVAQKIPPLTRLTPQIQIFDNNLKDLFNFRIIGKSVIFTVGIIFIEAVAVYLGFLTFGMEMNYVESTQIFYSSTLAGALSFMPGGVGVTEGSFIGQLVSKHFDLSMVTSLVIFIRLTTIWFSTSLGFLVSYFITRDNSFIKN